MRRFLTPRWLVRHALAVVLTGGCLAAGWWQIGRAAAGNLLSYGYSLLWPCFAIFVVMVWIREIRTELHPPEVRRVSELRPANPAEPGTTSAPETAAGTPAEQSAGDSAEDPDDPLDDYNRMLAWLNANPDRRLSDYRRGQR